ncbi:hypothetical protein DFH27DRAFT_475628 [Peziza echinospora]|nr:hypothetical protein DFH27DRAFT_475628 [Peziza echinospora]
MDRAGKYHYLVQSPFLLHYTNTIYNSGETIPASFGRRPCNIDEFGHRFKAIEWSLFLQYYSIPMLYQRLPGPYYRHWILLVKLWRLSIAYKINEDNVSEFHELAKSFVIGAQELYYQHSNKRAPIMDSNIHALLHIADGIRDMGPCWGTWAFPIERYCGTLASMARSKKKLSESLSNAVRLEDLLHHAGFARSVLGDDLRNIIRPTPPEIPLRSMPLVGNSMKKGFFVNAGVHASMSRGQQLLLLEYMKDFYGSIAIHLDCIPKEYTRFTKFRRHCINNNQIIGSSACPISADRTHRKRIYIRYYNMEADRGGFHTDDDYELPRFEDYDSNDSDMDDEENRFGIGYGEVMFYACHEPSFQPYPRLPRT